MSEDIKRLVGMTLTEVTTTREEVAFTSSDGRRFRLYYEPDCCAGCDLEDVIGDVADLVGSPIVMAELVTNSETYPEDKPRPEYLESFTWSFYRLATVKGYVTFRWLGESNGYYSETVSFAENS